MEYLVYVTVSDNRKKSGVKDLGPYWASANDRKGAIDTVLDEEVLRERCLATKIVPIIRRRLDGVLFQAYMRGQVMYIEAKIGGRFVPAGEMGPMHVKYYGGTMVPVIFNLWYTQLKEEIKK